jgi:PKD repeat protein
MGKLKTVNNGVSRSGQAFLAPAALTALLVLLLAACGGGDGAAGNGGAGAMVGAPPEQPVLRATPASQALSEAELAGIGAAASAGPGGLPPPAELAAKLRGARFTLAEGYSDGADFDAPLPNNRASIAGTSAVFAPDFPVGANGLDDAAYCLYSFTLPDYTGDAPVNIEFAWADAPSVGNAYIGLSDFDGGVWAWYVLPANNRLDFLGFTEFINAVDTHLLAVVLTGTDAAILDSLQISTAQLPLASIVPDLDSGVAPLSVSFDGSASADADGTLVNFEWDLDGDGLFNETGDEADAQGNNSAQTTYAAVGSYDATLRVTDDQDFQDEATAQINVSNSQPPVADLQADDVSGDKPLLVNFNATASMDPDGTVTGYEWDFDGDNNFSEADNGEDTALNDPTPPTVTYSAVGDYNATVRVMDNDGGLDTAGLVIAVTNSPPTADLQSDVSGGDIGLVVNFDGSGSTDAGGAISNYEWDFDGDGAYNEAGNEATAEGNSTPAGYMYLSPGQYTPALRVTDDDGATNVDTLGITVQGWVTITLDDTAAQDGYGVRMLLQDGLPLLACYTINGHSVRLLRSSTPLGTDPADWTRATVIGGAQKPTLTSLALIGGNPAVTFFSDDGTNSLYYSRSTTADAMSDAVWITPVLVDDANTPGLSATLLEVQGHPAIAYGATATSDTRYARANTPTGDTQPSWSNWLVDSEGWGVSMVLVGGSPAIAFSSGAGTIGCRYRRSSNNLGDSAAAWSGGVSATVYGDSSANYHFSLEVVNGKPAVAVMDADATTLYYAHAGSADGSGAWGSYLVDGSAPPTGENCSLALIGGKPAIGYYQSAAPSLPRFVSSASLDGDSPLDWTNEQNITDTGSTGRLIRLLELADGRAAVAYRDDGSDLLVYGVKY